MEKKVYIISFGNSTKYRFTPDNEDVTLSEVHNDVKAYLAKKYPQLSAPDYYDAMSVVEVNPANEEEYAGYKKFTGESVGEILKLLSGEIDSQESVSQLNSNAPWGDDPKE